MIQAFLAIITIASALGVEAPAIVKPFVSIESCLIEAQKQNNQNSEELQKQGAGFVCLVLTPPMI